MKYTSAEAAKLLRKLNDEAAVLRDMERRSMEFHAALGEDVESVRPAYDYAQTQKKLAELEEKIRRVKHAINCFNVTTTVPGFDMTIDQILVYIPQLSERKEKLRMMSSRLPKQRETLGGYGQPSVIDYNYANYDIDETLKDYEAAAEELSRAQTALDLLNTTGTMEIE